jgi:hypothetical protein
MSPHREILDSLSFETVWQSLGGGPMVGRGDNRRARAFWRDGDSLTVSVDLSAKVWKDHKTGECGGLLALVCTVMRVDHAAAWQWLSDLAGVPLARFTPSDAARYRAAVEATKDESKRLWQAWAAAYDAVSQYTDICFQHYHAMRDAFWNDATLTAVERSQLKADIEQAWRKYAELRAREERLVRADPGALVRLLRRADTGRAA